MLLSRFYKLFPSSHYVLLALLFFAGLEIMVAWQRLLIPIAGVFLMIMVIGIVIVRMEEGGRFRVLQAVLPALAVIGLTGFSVFLQHNSLLHLYFGAASLLLYWLLKHGAKLAYPTWNWTISTIVFFLDAATILGLRFHLYTPILAVLILILIVAFLISLQAIRRITPTLNEGILVALALAIVLAQITWVLQFLPIHYVVQAGVLMVLYYVFFHVISVSYERRLSYRDIMEYSVIGLFALTIILASARWL